MDIIFNHSKETHTPIAPRTKLQNFLLILMLGALCTITPFSIDMYLPALTDIANDLHTSVAKASLSVSTYFLGFALGQILYGPFLDRFGRKRPLYFGLSIYVVATIGCAFSHTVEMLLAFRFLQALGGSVASVAATAMVSDFFPAHEATKIFSWLMLILGISPLLAPTVGSMVVSFWQWPIIFLILAAVAVIVLTVLFFFLPEGHAPDPTIDLRLKPMLQEFGKILKTPQFYIYTFAGSLSFAGLFVYVAASPSIYMDGFQVSAKMYGAIFAFLSIGMIGGGQVNLLLVKKFSEKNIFKTALCFQAIVSAIFFIGALTFGWGFILTTAFLFVLLSCTGLTYPNAAAIALSSFSKNAGSAASLMGFIQMGTGAILSSIVGMLEMKGTLPTAGTISIASALGALILFGFRSHSRIER